MKVSKISIHRLNLSVLRDVFAFKKHKGVDAVIVVVNIFEVSPS